MSNNTYFCNYCLETHDDATRAREHVIPESLQSPTYTLNDTCAFWNNFFAISFENAITRSLYVRHLLTELGVGNLKGEQYLMELKTIQGTTEHLWIVDGKKVLRDPPKKETVNTVNLNVKGRDGTIQPVVVQLPFEILKGTFGDAELLKRSANRYLKEYERDKHRVRDYLTRVSQERDLDPELFDLIQSSGAIGEIRSEFAIKEEDVIGGVVDGCEVTFALDEESVIKLYAKIAWCHACKVLGPDILAQTSKWSLVGYLKSGLVSQEVVDRCEKIDEKLTRELFASGTAAGTQVWYWRRSIQDTFPLLASAPHDFFCEAANAFNLRREQDTHVQTRVTVTHPEETIGPPMVERWHSLELIELNKYDFYALACRIELFGGFWTACVRLTDWQERGSLPLFSPEKKLINF